MTRRSAPAVRPPRLIRRYRTTPPAAAIASSMPKKPIGAAENPRDRGDRLQERPQKPKTFTAPAADIRPQTCRKHDPQRFAKMTRHLPRFPPFAHGQSTRPEICWRVYAGMGFCQSPSRPTAGDDAEPARVIRVRVFYMRHNYTLAPASSSPGATLYFPVSG